MIPTSGEPVGRVLSVLHGVRRSSGGWMAKCPAHDDGKPSLSIHSGSDGRALVYCHAGCTLDAITAAVGLGPSDLFPDPPAKAFTVPGRLTPGRANAHRLFAVRDVAGALVALHDRTDAPDGKRMSWRLPGGTSGLGGKPASELPLFGSQNIPKWDASRPVIVAEGEEAAMALLNAGFRALGTVTGASGTPSDAVLHGLRGHHVVLWPDADDVGRTHMGRVAERLIGVAGSVRLLTWPDAPGGGDAADLLSAGSAADVDQLVEASRPVSVPGPVLVAMSTVEPEQVAWAWEPFLARGKINLIEGDPDLGKTTLALDIAARLSTGSAMPDGTIAGAPVPTIIISAEDGLADTVRPRLEAAGADLDRILALRAILEATGERLPALPTDFGAIEEAIVRVGAGLVILDPLVALLDGHINTWRDQDVRRVLAPLARMAERTGCAIVAIRHLNKSRGSHPMYRGGGSIGIIGAARVGLLVAADPDDRERRILATVKNNLAPHPPSLAFRLVGDAVAGAARLEWLGESAHGVSSLLALGAAEERRGALQETCDVLQAILADGPLAAREVQREARAAGISSASLRRAQAVLRIRPQKVGKPGEEGQHWVWALSEGAHRTPKLLLPAE